MIDLCTDIPGHPDPVATLVVRMYADPQLDACALRAIDADTRLAARSSRTTAEGQSVRPAPAGRRAQRS